MARDLAAPWRRREHAGGDGAPSRTVLANYATADLGRIRRRSTRSAFRRGRFDRVLEYGPGDLDPAFRRRNAAVLAQPRGAGYWIWKPYIIRDALRSIGDDEMLFYCDADMRFVAPLGPLRAEMRRDGIGVLGFRTHYVEHTWTKRDCFVLMDCDHARYRDTPQVRAGFSAWRRTPFAVAFVEEWLRLVQDERLATDLPSRCGLPEHPTFREHRHDQSVLSLLCKKHGVPTRGTWPFVTPHRPLPRRLATKAVGAAKRLARRMVRRR